MPTDTSRDATALIVVDVQNDFCPGGALAVPDGDAVVSVVNGLIEMFDHVVLTQDWHPAGHASFASSHAGKQPYEMVTLSYGDQVLWPDHCVQGTGGADFHAALDWTKAEMVVRKGYRPGDRLLFRLLRERSRDADGARRLSARAGHRPALCLRLGVRFLRALHR